VGALTSKPFRYSARTWELSRRKSISPHDGLGSNLVVQVKGDRVIRVLPLENESINECWISDKDRFSYEGLYSDDRLTAPMVRRNGDWQSVDWQTALEFIASRLREIVARHGGDALGTVVSPHSTLEEMALAAKLTRALGSDNIDFRLRQSDFGGEAQRIGIPWLGMPIGAVNTLDRVLVVGSFLRKDQPLLAQRLRQAVKKGARVVLVHAVDDDSRIPYAQTMVAAPSQWTRALGGIVVAAAQAAGKPVPPELAGIPVTEPARAIAQTLLSGKNTAILLGSAAQHHPLASQIAALAQALGEITGANVGTLTLPPCSAARASRDALTSCCTPNPSSTARTRLRLAPRSSRLSSSW